MSLKTLSLISKIALFIAVMSLMLFKSCNVVYAQETIPFTPAEVEQVAKNNLERKECIELNKLNEQLIDSLNLKVNLISQESSLKDSTINNFRSILKNYEHIDSLRVEQSTELLEANKEQSKTIKKQNR